ncbi:Protein of unknown function [Streptomyces sp. WMMB 714]|nr:Protein of unknown function [Streptomyces sp. WMMB 714]
MRLKNNVIAAALVPLALFAVTACDGAGSGTSKSESGSSAAGSSKEPDGEGSQQDGSGDGSSAGGGPAKEKATLGSGADGGSGKGSGGGPVAACSEDNSSMKIGEEQSAGLRYMLFVKNEGSAPCSIAPIPTVDAIDGETGEPLNDGQRDQTSGGNVTTLKPNYTASAYFTYDSSKCQGDSDKGAASFSVIASKNSIFTLKVPGAQGRSPFICGGPLTVSNWTLPKYQ